MTTITTIRAGAAMAGAAAERLPAAGGRRAREWAAAAGLSEFLLARLADEVAKAVRVALGRDDADRLVIVVTIAPGDGVRVTLADPLAAAASVIAAEQSGGAALTLTMQAIFQSLQARLDQAEGGTDATRH